MQTKAYRPRVRGSTVYVAIHFQARQDHGLPPDPEELPDKIPVEYHKTPDGEAKQVIDFSKIDHGD